LTAGDVTWVLQVLKLRRFSEIKAYSIVSAKWKGDYSPYVGFDPAISGWRVIQERRTFTLSYGKVSFA
jgi:hypothetical protein